MKIQSSRDLYTFYQNIGAAINGQESDWELLTGRGLCYNLSEYAGQNSDSMDHFALLTELTSQFIEARLDSRFPFNDEDIASYLDECDQNACFDNPKRKAWVFARLKDGVIGE